MQRDLDWFRLHTTGHVVVMGRKTWESIGEKPLPNRENIVVTSREIPGVYTISGDLKQITLKPMHKDKHIWIIGGAEIYSQCVPFADKLYLTTINGNFDADTYIEEDIITKFPVIDFWKEDY